MKFNCKYFLPLLIISCNGKNSSSVANNISPLYYNPIIVTLDTTNGYNINPITGDSVKPLLTANGIIIQSGVTIRFDGEPIIEKEKPKIISTNISDIKTTTNLHPINNKTTITPVDTNRLTKVKLGEGNQSFELRNTSGLIPTGKPLPISGKKIIFLESQPVKALPFKYKDAATANVQYLDVDQGLPFSYIYTLLEDKKGNMWFGIPGVGISKYDGVSFINYSAKGGLGDNSLLTMIEDHQGNIWFNTNKGLIRFDGNTFTEFTEKEGLPGSSIVSLYSDKKGNIWIATLGSGIGKYDGKNITWYTTKEGLPCDSVTCSMEDKKGNLWFGTHHGVAKYDGNIFTWVQLKDGLPFSGISSLLEDKNGNIWMSLKKGVIKFDGERINSFKEEIGLSMTFAKSIVEDKNGNIWVGSTFGGIYKFDGRSFTQYNLKEGLSNNKVRQLIEDSSGNIWFGTDGGGINKLRDGNFSYLPANEILANNRIRPILKDREGNMWIGTEGAGIGKYDAKIFSDTTTTLSYYSKKDDQYSHGQRSLLQDNKGHMWIGTTGGGIQKYDGKKLISYSLSNDLSTATIFSILEDRNQNLWFGTNSSTGLIKYNRNNFIGYTNNDGLPGNIVFSVKEDSNRNMWVGSDVGSLSKINGNKLVNYTAKEGFFGTSITSIISDKQGNLWLGTNGAGVCKFDGRQFIYYTEKQGLSNNNVWSLIQDPAGHIWAGTDKGLNRFVPKEKNKKNELSTYTIYQYGLEDGLKAIDFNLNGASIDNINRIWWGTGKNILIKDVNSTFKTSSPYSLSLTSIVINDKFYNYRNFPDSAAKKIRFTHVEPFSNYPQGLELSYEQNHLLFNFSAIEWSAPDKIKYSYRLKGWSENWSIPSKETKAEFRNLQHGKYVFEIKAIGQSQTWTNSFSYPFIIRPAWWQTWWFKTIIIAATLLLMLLIARFIYFYQLRKERTALEKKLAVQYERQRISAEMHDDIGAGLSGIRLLTEMTKNKIKNEQGAEEVDKIYQSVGDISSKMKEVIWSLNTENDNLPNLLYYIQQQVRLWLEHYPCQLFIKLPDTIPDKQINGETRRNIFLLVKEAVHNIIKHSGANHVTINMDCNKEQLVISILDNGKGISNGNGSGNGMKNMQQRIENLKGKFVINNKEGLTLTFEIPI